MGKNRYKITYNVAWQVEPINDFVYIYDLRQKRYLILRDTAKEMWLLIVSGINIEEMITKLCQLYKINQEDCYSDLISFIENLKKSELITVLQ